MFRLILVPLDGSPMSEQALAPALALARRQHAAVRLVRVYVPVLGIFGERNIPFDPALDKALQQNAETTLQQLAQRLAPSAGVPLDAQLLEGPIAETLDQYAVSVGADLLVMTTHARGTLARFWLGSVADRLVRHSAMPILFIRPQEAASDQPPPSADGTYRHVLIPLDGSQLAEQVLDDALALGATAQTHYTLLRVMPTLLPVTTMAAISGMGVVPDSVFQALRDEHHRSEIEAQAYLEQLADTLRRRTPHIQVRLLPGDRPADTILQEAATHHTDLIALTTRGQGGLKRLLLGSVADKVLRASPVPVLIRPPAERAAASPS
jgi:nucleotide-binding universal stress UspA family protein